MMGRAMSLVLKSRLLSVPIIVSPPGTPSGSDWPWRRNDYDPGADPLDDAFGVAGGAGVARGARVAGARAALRPISSELLDAMSTCSEMYFDDELRGRLASEGGGGYLVRAICSMSSEAAALAALHALYKNTHVRADAFSASALLCAISRNYVEVAKLLLTHPRSRETFYPPRAAVTQTTVARQWCVFPRGRDPYELVMTAADTDATAAAMLSVLLEHPSLREQVYVGVCLGGSSYSSSYSSSYNVLQTAASRGFLAAINVLDAADPRILADHGEDALRVAVHEGHLDVVARLLAASKCVTPFMDACNIATESLVRPLNQPPRQLPRYRHVPRDTMLAIARSFVEDRGVSSDAQACRIFMLLAVQ